MLVWLADFSGTFPILNVFRYITFRAGGATATALLVVFFFGPAAISWLAVCTPSTTPRTSSKVLRSISVSWES